MIDYVHFTNLQAGYENYGTYYDYTSKVDNFYFYPFYSFNEYRQNPLTIFHY